MRLVLVLLMSMTFVVSCWDSKLDSKKNKKAEQSPQEEVRPVSPAPGTTPGQTPTEQDGSGGSAPGTEPGVTPPEQVSPVTPAPGTAPEQTPPEQVNPDDSASDTDPQDPPSGVVNLDNDRSPLGTNLGNFVDWSTEIALVDIFKYSRPWISGSSGGAWDDGRAVALDENGYVASLQPGQIARTLMFWGIPGKYPAGRYDVFYEGKGSLEYWAGARKIDSLSTPGHDVIQVENSESNNGICINITSTDSSDHLRNIRVIIPGGYCSDDVYTYCDPNNPCATGTCQLFKDTYQTQYFNPRFLSDIRKYKVLRFMDWMDINGSSLVQLADMSQMQDARFSVGRSGPLDLMIDLANTTGADPWFCMPHEASDDFVRQFATRVRNQLNSNLKAYIEYSNETWNGIFDQASYVQEKGLAAGLSANRYEAGALYHAKRAVEIFKIWENVFGSADRLVRVIASQAANSWLSDTMLGYADTRYYADALAVAPYFGGDLGTQSSTASMDLNQVFEELRNSALPESRSWSAAQKTVADKYSVDLIAYEGGQHMVGVFGLENNANLNTLFDAANKDSRMKQLYLDYLDDWKLAGGRLFVHYLNCGQQSKWGRWGSLEYTGQSRGEAPKYDALQTFIDDNPQWW